MQKQYYLLLIFFMLMTFNTLYTQNVNIPDLAFKNKLIALGIDSNQDGTIQVSEAAIITKLDVSYSYILNITGISAFVNLDTLYCNHNQFTNLDVSALTGLKMLNCGENQLATLDVSSLTNLEHLSCYSISQLTLLNINGLTNLRYLDCHQINITTLNLSNASNLKYLNVSNCQQLAALNVANLTQLEYLNCSVCFLPTLDVNTLVNLTFLDCSANNLTALDVTNLVNLDSLAFKGIAIDYIDVSNATNLRYIDAYAAQLDSIKLGSLPSLEVLYCSSNNLQKLEVNGAPKLRHLDCSYNNLTSLDVTNVDSLISLNCRNNQLATLDLSNQSHLESLDSENNQLITLFVKNGSSENLCDFTPNNSNLQYICADANNINALKYQCLQDNMYNTEVNSYCSFSPYGNFNTVMGKSRYDQDQNGCNPSDSSFAYLTLAVSAGGSAPYYICTNVLGDYIHFLGTGNYQFTPILANPSYFSATPPSSSISFTNLNNNLQNLDFCIIPNDTLPDVSVVIMPLTAAEAGFDAEYALFFQNKGTTTASDTLIFNFPSTKMTFLSADQAVFSQNAGELKWVYTNLQPFENRTIKIKLHVLPPPTNNIGQSLSFSADINLANDVAPSDNADYFIAPVVGAYDPNDKTCLEGHALNNSQIGEYLHYLIRFQNTGTAPAHNVVVVDTLNGGYFDVASLQILSTSHDAHISIKNNVLESYFENIYLPDSFSNEPASHGYILYKIKTRTTLAPYSTISNRASIYFDYNQPVLTNTESTTFSNVVEIAPSLQSPQFQCYPNPAQNSLMLITNNPIEIEIVNIMGEVVLTKEVEGAAQLDIAALAKGIYCIKERYKSVGKLFVKE